MKAAGSTSVVPVSVAVLLEAVSLGAQPIAASIAIPTPTSKTNNSFLERRHGKLERRRGKTPSFSLASL
ncbi:MAG: hypothetical protein LBI64_02835 [Coriobacteriales bacterium]|jgi:hypothetical protein|nr:hypothetical protein [Coriobacteriales bacterium]